MEWEIVWVIYEQLGVSRVERQAQGSNLSPSSHLHRTSLVAYVIAEASKDGSE